MGQSSTIDLSTLVKGERRGFDERRGLTPLRYREACPWLTSLRSTTQGFTFPPATVGIFNGRGWGGIIVVDHPLAFVMEGRHRT